MINALKAVNRTGDNLVVENYIVLFGGRDLEGEYFTKSTILDSAYTQMGQFPVDWEHGFYADDNEPGRDMLGIVDWNTVKVDDIGVFVQRVLDRRNRYISALDEAGFFEDGIIGTSSEAYGAGIAKTNNGEIKAWPLIKDTLTVAPMEPRMISGNQLSVLKSLSENLPGLKAVISKAERSPATDDTMPEVGDGGEKLNSGAKTMSEIEDTNDEVADVTLEDVFGAIGQLGENVDTRFTHLESRVDELETQTDEDDEVDEGEDEAPQKGIDVNAIADATVAKLESNKKASNERLSAAGFLIPGVNVNLKTKRGDSEAKAFCYFIREGDWGALGKAYKASNDTSMNIAADGGNAVPTGHFNGIIARRDEMMLAPMLGVRDIPGRGSTVNVPVDNEDDGEFVSTSEQNDGHTNNFDRDAPALSQVAMTLVKYSKKVELTDELLEDEDSRLMAFLEDFIGRGAAKTHNSLLVTEVLANGTAAVTAASATAIAAGEVVELEYDLADEYADGAAWLMRRSTEGAIRQLQGNEFLFQSTPSGEGRVQSTREIDGYPVYNSQNMPAIATTNKTVVFGNFFFVGKREAPGMTLIRDPYSVDGMLVLKYYFRTVYSVLQAEALQYLTQA